MNLSSSLRMKAIWTYPVESLEWAARISTRPPHRNRPLKAIHKDHFQLRALSLSSAVEDDLDDAFNNEIHTPIRKRRREQRSSRADEELASVLRTLAEENKKNKYEHFADEVACCLKTVEDRNPTLALDMKRQIQEVCYNFEKKSLDLL
ncbi:hypothetical protein QR680_017249 [Steinernema hermaphroditum]|uniref:Uncharacterized protein n=1 Tax=Steinernema hermaphroditum TaxID=289476 RepID=A0AA39HDW1_9BILA|nr:hypothetical protein QR680_017249 [Steinernema hermaphroditum]